MAAQSIGLQAGYGYASTIDPTSQADSSVLGVLTMLFTSLLIFSLGIDHQLIRILAASFTRFPAGSWTPSLQSMDGILRLGSGMLSTGLRLAFPVIALLLLIDVASGTPGPHSATTAASLAGLPGQDAGGVGSADRTRAALPRLFQISAGHTMSALWRVLDR